MPDSNVNDVANRRFPLMNLGNCAHARKHLQRTAAVK